MKRLPIDDILGELIEAVQGHGAAVLIAPPGAGKTTRVPPALLDADIAGSGKILVLQPRRIAARTTARRMASERGGHVGGEVGYAVRFERKISAKTRIEVLTEGMLTRRLQADPFLEGVGCVILDEFHERSLHADLALALLTDVRAEARPDLCVVVMSATLDPDPVRRFLGDCPVVTSAGRTHPIAIHWDSQVDDRRLAQRVASAVVRLADLLPKHQKNGHILVFLPGVAEIRWCTQSVSAAVRDCLVLPLHGGLSAAAQDKALAPSALRKIILATNVAETSLTIDGVVGVIDSGLVRQPRLDPALGVERLETVNISRASADQRAGRAGRTGPGICLRLWPEGMHRGLRPFDPPSIRKQDLTRLLLEVRSWGVELPAFQWFERPPQPALDHADSTLRLLGAVDDTGLTAVGRRLAQLPLHPRLGRVLLAGADTQQTRLAAGLAALASERDLLRERRDTVGDSDLDLRLAVIDAVDRGLGLERAARQFGADARALRQVMAVRDQLVRVITQRSEGARGGARPTGDSAAAKLLLSGYPDRVAKRRGPNSQRLLLVGGRGAELDRRSCVRTAPLVLAVTMAARQKDPIVYAAIALEPELLATEDVLTTRFDLDREAAVQQVERRYLDLPLSARPAGKLRDQSALSQALTEATRAHPERALRLDDAAQAWLGRLRWLARALPDAGLPDLHELDGSEAFAAKGESDETTDVLRDLCDGRRAWAELRQLDLAKWLTAWLPWQQRALLEKQAPERWKLPCGVSASVRYPTDGAPIISAKAQHFFGLTETPRLAQGRAPVRCELLAPNGRPAQVTGDIAGFWQSSWLDVRKDLRGRYPKHPWPEIPTVEQARKGRRRPKR
ncbi:MAG: ATP-dependent helicase HrpB [Myxococcales bacterium]|nr:ATP-dependent helicase HrpB [Myxococcales bacterium]